ncbi:MAG: transposase family protein, partial [Planctomycetales bacterium]|nr:transposase family protein [Planctomycetales bacterium]
MRKPSIYVKMKVLGAIDVAEGRTRDERIRNVAQMTFLDEEGQPHRFTWRTIQTWHYRYKNSGITGMTGGPRSDKGATRKVTPEEVMEAINAALPHFHGKAPNKTALYRFCIEKGLLRADQIARNTFSRLIREYDLLKADDNESNKRRLAFSMQYANQLWQADTMFGPHVQGRQAKLIGFIDDASRVLCHGEFFFDENADSMVRAIRAAFYKRGVPEQLLVDNGSVYCCQEIILICARVGCLLRHTAVRAAAAKGKIER